jgi:sulfide:quinone oxidoreductase
LEFDYLVIAIGASKLTPKGKEHVRSICGVPEQALEIRDQLDALIEKGTGKIAIGFGGNPKDKSAVRGGPAFELVFNIHHYLKRKKIRDQFDLTFFAPMPKPGARMGGNSLKMMDKMFKRYKINKHFGQKINGFEKNVVLFENGETLEADMIMYISAGSGHVALRDSGLALNEAGFIKINDFGQVENFENIYAIGDTAEIKGFDWVAKQGHLAEVMGRNAAHNIICSETGKSNFKGYHHHLNILCLMDTGHGAAYVFRNDKKAYQIPLPIIGHWMKRAWGVYAKLNKVSAFPRLPGM